jgi:hypothetical protein
LRGSLGADGGWHARLGVGQGTLSAAWALDVGRLRVVDGRALVRLGNVLALARHVNNAPLGVQELGCRLGDSRATTSHEYWVLLHEKKSWSREAPLHPFHLFPQLMQQKKVV